MNIKRVIIKWRTTLGLGDGGEIYILSPERQPNKELKYRICTKVHQRIFSSELLMNSEQKADETHVSPAIAKPTVACCTIFTNELSTGTTPFCPQKKGSEKIMMLPLFLSCENDLSNRKGTNKVNFV
jgi:hypothetical protein